MSPLTPEEPELAVAIVMEPESSEVPTPLVTLTAPPVSPDATRDGHGATHSPAAAITDASRQRQRASRGAVSGGLASRHGHRPAGAGVAIPHAQGNRTPRAASRVARLHRKRPRRPGGRLPGCQRHVAADTGRARVGGPIVMEPDRPKSRRRSSHSRRRPC